MKRFSIISAALIAASIVCSNVQASEITLTVQHFLSPKAPSHTKLIQPWAERVEKQSGGRIKVEIFPSMSMGGKPPELYRQVRDGAVDIVWTVAGYTPGVFPRTEVFELPSVHQGSSVATNLAIQDLSELLAADYKDVHPLLIHTHAGNAFHMREKGLTDVSSLKGKKVRTPSRTGAWFLEALGAEPVGMPVPALPQALAKGAVDGALVPFEIVVPLKLHELTNESVEGPAAQRFGTSVFIFAMNKDRYDSLPADLKKVIDDNSGINIAKDMGQVWMDIEVAGKDLQKLSGGDVNELSQEAHGEIRALSKTVVDRWIKEATDKGLNGAEIVEKARAAIVAHSK